MITVKQAQREILKVTKRMKKVSVQLGKSLGSVLAENINAPIQLPVANNSAMDGFVIRSGDTAGATKKNPVLLKICGAIKAGDHARMRLKCGEAFRIMTGAFIPKGGDAIILKEKADVRYNYIYVYDHISKGSHIRKAGKEVKRGERVLEKNTFIHPAVVGLLAALGKKQVKVFQKPRVSLIVSGNELVQPGNRLKPGKIYESNSWMIGSILKSMGIDPAAVYLVKDRIAHLKIKLNAAFKSSDAVILTGGVSVGDYDFGKDALKELGVRTIFWKVAQKPGKPLYFGKKGRTMIFGLPGNPAAVFTCFYEYIFPTLRYMMGFQYPKLRRVKVRLESSVHRDARRNLFLKAKVSGRENGKTALPLKHQASHMISSLASADSFVLVPPGMSKLKKGAYVEADLIPFVEEAV